MTLALIDPSPSPVILHEGGLITVRCADYVGAARGTLSTVSDPLAAAGTAVKEEQTVAVNTGTTGIADSTRFSSVSDTIVVPLGDLPRESRQRYLPWISLRTEGDPPITAHAKGSWLQWARNANAGVGFGIPAFASSLEWIPSRRVANYTLADFFNEPVFESEPDSDNFVVRAWMPIGGDMAIFLETLYFVPLFDASTSYGEPQHHAHSQYFPTDKAERFFSNGVVWQDDTDEDPADLPDGFGKFSVLFWELPWAPGSTGWGQLVEFQAAENETTVPDLNSSGTWVPPTYPDPIRGHVLVPVGLTYIPEETLLTDDFSTEQTVHGTYGAHYVSKVGDYTRALGLGSVSAVTDWWDAPSPVGNRRGTFVEAGDGFATTYFGPSSGANAAGSGHDLAGGLKGYYGHIAYGGSEREGGFASSEAGNYNLLERRFQPHLEAFVISCRVRVVGDAAPGNGGMVVGATYDSIGPRRIGANLAIDASGNVTLSLEERYSTFTPDWDVFVPAVTVGTGYSPGDWFWVKVEKRGYGWRARAWADGDPEPSAWDVEGFQPLLKTSTGIAPIDYPWDTNWLGDVNNDSYSYDPRGGPREPSPTATLFPYIEMYWASGQTRERINTADVTIEWDPGGSSPGDFDVQMESHDGGIDFGTVTVPYGAHRFIRAGRDALLTDADTHGWNLRAWRDPSNPDLCPVGIGRHFLRFPLGAPFVPYIYRRPMTG